MSIISMGDLSTDGVFRFRDAEKEIDRKKD